MSINERLCQLQNEQAEKKRVEDEQREHYDEILMLEEQMHRCTRTIDKLEIAKKIADLRNEGIETKDTAPQRRLRRLHRLSR